MKEYIVTIVESVQVTEDSWESVRRALKINEMTTIREIEFKKITKFFEVV